MQYNDLIQISLLICTPMHVYIEFYTLLAPALVHASIHSQDAA